MPPSNSSTSLTEVSGSPATRVMPSPTSSTWPTLAESRVGVNVETCALQRGGDLLDVDGQLCHLVPSEMFLWLDLFAQLVEAVTDATRR